MKIECDKCAAKYSIADEKVRGKTFKIRCKKCSNVIIVRDKGAAADDGADDAGADQGAPGWHLAINGETVGPLAEHDVRARYSAGEIDKDTAVWQEGFEDWIPLGDIPAFDDLPDGVLGGGGGYGGPYGQEDDDPFANANQEDYAAGAAAAASAAVAAAAPEPAASPRVTALTGQRNENSVLFSLDSLQALATNNNNSSNRPKPSAGSNQQVGTKGLATAAPGSEGSGLIDIRALGSMVGSDQPVTASSAPAAVDDAALPSFGGTGLGGLAAAPLMVASPMPEPAAAAAAAAPPPPQRSNAPIYVLMALLILALGGLAAYILLKPEQQPQVIVKEVPGAAPSVADKDDKDDEKKQDEDDEEKKDEDEDEDKDKDGADDEGGEGEGEDAAAEEDKSGGKKSSGGKKTSGGKKSSGGTKKSGSDDPLAGFGDPPPKSSGSTKPSGSAPAKKEDVSLDCILDPSKCKKGGSTKSSGSSGSSKPAAADPSLPAALTSSDIRAGVAPFKSAAKACGGKHGAAPGTKVKIKLSITGATGTVASASPEAPHNGTPLGNCVAAAIKGAKFQKFQKSQLGAVYPFTM